MPHPNTPPQRIPPQNVPPQRTPSRNKPPQRTPLQNIPSRNPSLRNKPQEPTAQKATHQQTTLEKQPPPPQKTPSREKPHRWSIIVQPIPPHFDDAKVLKFFEHYGKIVESFRVGETNTKRPTNYYYVEYATKQAADDAAWCVSWKTWIVGQDECLFVKKLSRGDSVQSCHPTGQGEWEMEIWSGLKRRIEAFP
ncbi:hypothetical protein MMC28_001991 [Mycoblastus sanguinarius]|nr:hypothetical protein [Mycoblastus sanguinarius]